MRRCLDFAKSKVLTMLRKNRPLFIKMGIYFFPILLVIGYFLTNNYVLQDYESLTFLGHLALWGMTGISCIGIGILNLYLYYSRGKRCFASLTEYIAEERFSRERARAMYPTLSGNLLFSKPIGVVLGKMGFGILKKYVCIDVFDKSIANHIAIVGSSAAGKSSGPILTSLITNFQNEKPPIAYLVIDTKPELANLTVTDERWGRTLNPGSRQDWGYDLYWMLDKKSTNDEVYSVMRAISEVLIPEANRQNSFFSNNARNLLCACLMFEYGQERNFIDSIRCLLQQDLLEYITTIKNMVNPHHRIYMLLSEIKADDKSNALHDIRKTLKENLEVFMRDDVAWFLDTKFNKKMCTPKDLDKGISLFLSIKREDLKQYNVLFRLIISQTMEHLSRREEGNPQLIPVVMVLDEFVNLGAPIPNYCENLGFIRSKRVTFVTIFQQYSQLQELYGKEQARTILNMGHLLVLSTEDTELGKILSDKAGEFWEEKVDHRRIGTFIKTKEDAEHVVQSRERRIRVMDDLASLGPRFESIAFINGGEYYRFDKCRYYLEKELREYAEKCKEINSIKRNGYLQEELK